MINYPDDPESYWGLVLCRYDIEYVEDPKTLKKIPTCHRTELKPVQTDADYLSALDLADTLQRSLYEREAEEIDRLQKNILAIVHNEKTFDVFICYKETDADGKRTPDSVIANDIYYQLTQEGFKVFYSAITLEDKLGQEYEPYIYAALHSAKVMLVLGTKPEYFEAVWVRNEWSRYLKVVREDRSKLLIPCYKDMDAYELPDEFAHLQAQDMSKIGFINDIIRGIRKLIAKDTPAPTVVKKENVIHESTNANIVPLLKHTKIFLEEGEWQNVKDYCNRVLDMDPENGQAYLYAFLSDLQVHSIDELPAAPMYGNLSSYKRMKRYADDSILDQIKACNQEWLYRWACSLLESHAHNELDAAEAIFKLLGDYSDSTIRLTESDHKKQELFYQPLVDKFDHAKNVDDLRRLKSQFEALGDFMDAPQKAYECEQKALQIRYDAAIKPLQNTSLADRYLKLQKEFQNLGDFLDSRQKAEECSEKAKEASKKSIYNKASALMKKAETAADFRDVINEFEAISDYKDSQEQIKKCKAEIQRISDNEEAQRQAVIEAAKKAIIVGLVSGAAIVAAATAVTLLIGFVIIPNVKYSKANKLLESGHYEEAMIAFYELEDFKDSADKLKEAKYD